MPHPLEDLNTPDLTPGEQDLKEGLVETPGLIPRFHLEGKFTLYQKDGKIYITGDEDRIRLAYRAIVGYPRAQLHFSDLTVCITEASLDD
jgi:hypothetical protein